MNNSVVPSNETGAPVSAATGGRRRRSSLRVVKKTVKRMLRKMGVKLRGGAEAVVPDPASPSPASDGKMSVPPSAPVEGGRRRRASRKTRRHKKRGLFGLRR